jgi:1A family penicillin-binding protein
MGAPHAPLFAGLTTAKEPFAFGQAVENHPFLCLSPCSAAWNNSDAPIVFIMQHHFQQDAPDSPNDMNMRQRMLALLALGVLILGTLAYLKIAGDLPAPYELITRASPDATKIYDRNGRLLYEVLDPRAGRRTRVSLDDLPPYFRQAVVAVEDANFYENPGVDAAGIVRAAIQNFSAGYIVAGGSTITQQLARDLLLSKEERESRSYLRKLREAILAIRLTQAFSKDQILEMYLNEVYYGNLAYGAEAAARTYFGKPARDLDLAESALLAGLIQSPALYDPFTHLDASRARQSVVLGLMVKRGLLSDAQAQLALAEPLHFVGYTSRTVIRAPHFVTYVRDLLEAEYGAETVNHGGLSVVTTLDLDLQERAEAIVRQQLGELERRTREEGAPDYNVHDAALVALDPTTGEILAMVGSADYFDEAIDGAVNVAVSNRQPGSAIKPITYATAFGGDYTPATVLSDVPTTFLTKENQPYEPQNYDRAWHGPMSLRQALASSNNLIAVKVLDHVGLDAMVTTAKELGITTFDDSDRFGLALTLGGGEVKLLELTAAYAAFANQGQRVEPRAIRQVNGQPLGDMASGQGQQPTSPLSPLPAQGRGSFDLTERGDALPFLLGKGPGVRSAGASPISPQVAYLITSILSDDSARISAFGEDSFLQLSRPAAAKTGTTTDYKDNWTIGYTPDLAVGVWAGNADNEPMYKISGITGAAPIWHDFMEEALRSRPWRDFERPDGLVDVEICDTSGLLPTEYCPRRRTEVFITGTQPTRPDDTYRPVALDSATGLLWTDGPDQKPSPEQSTAAAEGCRGTRSERVYRFLPPEAQEWGSKQGIPEPPTMNCQGELVTWEQGDTGSNGLSPCAPGSQSACLVVTSPPPNSTFSLSEQIPAELQQIEVMARLNTPTTLADTRLLIDGQPIGTFSRPPYRALWRLAAGDHTVQAISVDSQGNPVQSEILHFQVEQPEQQP